LVLAYWRDPFAEDVVGECRSTQAEIVR